MKHNIAIVTASVLLAISASAANALDAWELYQQAKPDQVGIIAASKVAREQCTNNNASTPCNNISNVLRVFKKYIYAQWLEMHPQQARQLYDEGELWCPIFNNTEETISLYTELTKEDRSKFEENLNEIKKLYNIKTSSRLHAEVIIDAVTSRLRNIITTIKSANNYEAPNELTAACKTLLSLQQPFYSNIEENRYDSIYASYIGPIYAMEDDIKIYLNYRDQNRPLAMITAQLNDEKNTPIGVSYDRDSQQYTPVAFDHISSREPDEIAVDIYDRLEETLRIQNRRDIPNSTRADLLKRSHAMAPLNSIITAQYIDSLIATKNQSEIATTKRFLEGIAYPITQAERKSDIIKLQNRPYFGNPRYSQNCTLHSTPKCSANEIDNINNKIIKILEASALLRQKSDLYEAAAKQVKKLELPKYYENYFLHYAAIYSRYSTELKWNIKEWRKLAKKVASRETPQSYTENNVEQSGEAASSNFNRLIETSRPLLKGKDLQRLNQYQSGMDLINSIMGQ